MKHDYDSEENKLSDQWIIEQSQLSRLNKRIESLKAALNQCEKWFTEYADSHQFKYEMSGATDSNILGKAKRNRDRAEFCKQKINME